MKDTAQKRKESRWSHQTELEHHARQGRTVTIIMNTGVVLTGTLLAADQFTIKIDVRGVNGEGLNVGEGSVLIINKHALATMMFPRR